MNPSEIGDANARRKPASSASTIDAELVNAARRGDKRAFVEIVARHQAMVCGIAFGILGDFAASEDAGQEALLTAWRKFDELREPERLRQWLGRIARNTALGHLRQRRGHGVLEDATSVPDPFPTPDQVAATEEEAALVRESLARLPQTYRVPLVLFYRESQSIRAVAEALGISEAAVKQRLARGREMLRDRMSGLIETVLTRTGPTAVFTMTIAAAIGALTPPAALAASVSSAASAASVGSESAASLSSLLATMSISKTSLITAALIAAACVPAGFYAAIDKPHRTPSPSQIENKTAPAQEKTGPALEESEIFAEWRELHELHGTTAEAMPALYNAITAIRDPVRRRGFRAALIAEWVLVDAPGGMAFFMKADAGQARQFFEEWLASDAPAALDALTAAGPGWERIAQDTLTEIARKVPWRVAAIVARLASSDSYWGANIRDAFAIVAEGGLASARETAEALSGLNRQHALAGVAMVWGRGDLDGAIAWARALPEGTDHDEIIRAALLGKAAVDPGTALNLVTLVPPGGKETHFASTTAGRVLLEAAKAGYDATVAWLTAHPGRLSGRDVAALAGVVADRLNTDPAGFLNRHAEDGSLLALVPAINSAMQNDASGQQLAVWEWLREQPDDSPNQLIRQHILKQATYNNPALAMRLVEDFPNTPDGERLVRATARDLLNNGQFLHRFDSLFEQAPERMRQPLIEAGFSFLFSHNLQAAQPWIDRLPLLPESSRASAVERIAGAWASQSPEDAIRWVESMPEGEARSGAVVQIASGWAGKDPHGAAQWVAAMPAGETRSGAVVQIASALARKDPYTAAEWAAAMPVDIERNLAVESVVRGWANQFLDEATSWALSLPPGETRNGAIAQAAYAWAAHDPVATAGWVASMPPGIERDRSSHALAATLARTSPHEAWQWALSIGDAEIRNNTARTLATIGGRHDPATARSWIEAGSFTPEIRLELEATVKTLQERALSQ
jgi:RNA polymerase sigma factor (sigma-70 family)